MYIQYVLLRFLNFYYFHAVSSHKRTTMKKQQFQVDLVDHNLPGTQRCKERARFERVKRKNIGKTTVARCIGKGQQIGEQLVKPMKILRWSCWVFSIFAPQALGRSDSPKSNFHLDLQWLAFCVVCLLHSTGLGHQWSMSTWILESLLLLNKRCVLHRTHGQMPSRVFPRSISMEATMLQLQAKQQASSMAMATPT